MLSQTRKSKETIKVSDLVRSFDKRSNSVNENVSKWKKTTKLVKDEIDEVMNTSNSIAQDLVSRRSAYMKDHKSQDPTTPVSKIYQQSLLKSVDRGSQKSKNSKYAKKSWKELKQDLVSEYQDRMDSRESASLSPDKYCMNQSQSFSAQI